MASSPLYEALDPSKYHIRVLRLLPGPPGSIVQCELQLCSLIVYPRYVALSYCWGDEKNREKLILNQVEITVTVNLEKALQALRALNVEFVWADALCINQNDLIERSLQVRQMDRIYSLADATYAWIGDGLANNAVQALKMLQHAPTPPIVPIENNQKPTSRIRQHLRQDMSRLGLLAHAELPSELDNLNSTIPESSYESILQLMQLPYWQRRWIIQEAAISKSTQVICGDTVLDFTELYQALEPYTKNKAGWTAAHASAFRFLAQIAALRKRHETNHKPDLMNAIFATKDSLSRDDRDKVFALLGTCKDGKDLVSTPSYEGTPEDLSIYLTRELLRRNAAFETILSGGISSTRNKSLPTWCPDWLSGQLPRQVYWVASRPPRIQLTYGKTGVLDDSRRIQVQGIELGTVVAMTSVLSSTSATSTVLTGSPIQPPSLPHVAQTMRCYGSHARAALGSCLRGNWGLQQSYIDLYRPYTPESAELQMILLMCQSGRKIGWRDFNGPRWPSLHSWLAENKDFVINGQTLRQLCTPRLGRLWLPMAKLWLAKPNLFMRLVYVAGAVFGPILVIGLAAGIATVNWILLVVGGLSLVLGVSSVFVLGTIHFTCQAIYDRFNEITEKPALESARLVVLDTGDIALASADIDIDDKLCFIAGCDSTVVFRKTDDLSEQLHRVVGRAYICISEQDQEKYYAFWSGQGLSKPVKVKTAPGSSNRAPPRRVQAYSDVIDSYKHYDNWRHYTLI